MCHEAVALAIVMCVVCPFSDQGIDHGVLCIGLLAQAVYGDIAKEWFLTTGRACQDGTGQTLQTGIVVALAVEAPFLHRTTGLINVVAAVAEPTQQGADFAQCARLIGCVAILVHRITVVVLIVLIPHVAHQIIVIIMEHNLCRIVIDLGLHQAFTIVLIHSVNIKGIAGQLCCFHCETNGGTLAT